MPELSDRTVAIALQQRLHDGRVTRLFVMAMGPQGVYASVLCKGPDGNVVEVKANAESFHATLVSLLHGMDEALNAPTKRRP